MKFDFRTIVNTLDLSPLDLQVFLPCMAALLLFAGGLALGKTFPTTVSVSARPAETVVTKSHGKYGAPRWLQQGTLVADVNRSL